MGGGFLKMETFSVLDDGAAAAVAAEEPIEMVSTGRPLGLALAILVACDVMWPPRGPFATVDEAVEEGNRKEGVAR